MPELISAISLKKLWHFDPKILDGTTYLTGAKFTPANLKALLTSKDVQSITNIHQDTWTYEEAEASQDVYRNQLTGNVYRKGVKTNGDTTVNFTIGQYDYATKAAFVGGTHTETSWERGDEVYEIDRGLIGLTHDGVYIVLPNCSINAHSANTDGAVGLAVVATMMEHKSDKIRTEYWFSKSDVDAATLPMG